MTTAPYKTDYQVDEAYKNKMDLQNFKRELEKNTREVLDDISSSPILEKEVDRILSRLRQSKAFQRAVSHTMSSNGFGSIRLDIARGKVKRVVSEAVYLEED